MEPFIADWLKNPKVPKLIRCGVVAIISLFIVFIGVICAVNSPFSWGKIFGIILATAFLGIGIYICIKMK